MELLTYSHLLTATLWHPSSPSTALPFSPSPLPSFPPILPTLLACLIPLFFLPDPMPKTCVAVPSFAFHTCAGGTDSFIWGGDRGKGLHETFLACLVCALPLLACKAGEVGGEDIPFPYPAILYCLLPVVVNVFIV